MWVKQKKNLGWQPQQSFEAGIEKTIAWYLDNEDYWKYLPSNIFNPTPWKD